MDTKDIPKKTRSRAKQVVIIEEPVKEEVKEVKTKVKKERTPEEVEKAKLKMAAVRSAKKAQNKI